MYKWNQINKDHGLSDKGLLENPNGFKPYIVENAISRVLVEIMDWIEQIEIQKKPVESPVRSPKKGK